MGLPLVAAELEQVRSPAIAAMLIEKVLSVMLLVHGGVLADTREFLAKDTYA